MLRLSWLLATLALLDHVHAFDVSRNDNLAVYWGQNSYGATHSDTANFQKTLSFYCQDDSIDVFPLAFLDQFFGPGGLPHIDLGNICNPTSDSMFSGSSLLNCQFLASDIQTCQAKGKIVTLSMGGGAAGGVSFSSAAQAQSFADQIWNLFLGGSSSTRPFGNAVLDGIDLDIEGGSTQYFDTFINQIRSHAAGASKKYYITGAPQCPFPDAYMGAVLNAVAFDMVYVQFYNNYCGLGNFNLPQDWNFADWDNWAKTTSKNKNVKIFIGAPGAPLAAGSGYVDASTLGNIIQQTRAAYSSFGGVMMWDASQAYANNRYDAAIKSFLRGGGGSVPPVPTTSTPKPTTSTPKPTTSTPKPTTTTKPPTSGSCAGVAAWSSSKTYNGGDQVTYNGHLWTAKWWSQADVPGGSAGDWTDNGACTSFDVLFTAPGAAPTAAVHSNAETITKLSSVALAPTKSVVASGAKTASASQVVKTASPETAAASAPVPQAASEEAKSVSEAAKTVSPRPTVAASSPAAAKQEAPAAVSANARAHARAFRI